MPTVTNGPIRALWVAPCLLEGGAENQQLDVVAAVDANPPEGGVTWLGCVVLEQSESQASPTMLAATRAVMPVYFGEAALYDQAAQADVLLAWAVYPYPALATVLESPPKLIYIDHRAENWTTIALTWLAPASAIVAVSSLVPSHIPETFQSITQIIFNGVDPTQVEFNAQSKPRPAQLAAWGVPAGSSVAGFIGRLEPERDPAAMWRLATNRTDLACVVIGEGSMMAELQSIAQVESTPALNLYIVGPSTDVASAYNAFDWLIQPTTAEAFGMTTAGALWVGTPVIATPLGLPAINPALVRSIDVDAPGSEIGAAVSLDEQDTEGTASRVSQAQAWARQNLGPTAFGQAYSGLLSRVVRGA